MKIRNGFVSNSSSSSFVLITSVENHQKALDTFQGKEKDLLESISCLFDDGKLFDRNIYQVRGYNYEGDSWLADITDSIKDKYDDKRDSWDITDELESLFYKYLAKVRENKEECIYNENDY